MPSKNKSLKKLLYYYWEVCPKLNPDGKLKQEMILVCNAIRNDLQHPNEYIRGATLRFLTKLHEPELLEPLLATVRSCLEHRHSYVRKNAVLAVFSIYNLSDHLIPDAPELIVNFLATESDNTCKRNAFIALCNIDTDQAVQYVLDNMDSVPLMDELMQSVIIEFVRKDALVNSDQKGNYMQLLFDLLESPSNAVAYEAATSLSTLTSNISIIKGAASKFIDLSIKESDNNVKLIVLERVDSLKQKYPGSLNDLAMEVLRVLSSPDLDVRRKGLDIALDMVSSKNIDEVILLLKRELSRTVEQGYDDSSKYRQLLIQAIHTCAIKYPEVASSVVYLLMDFIGDFNSDSAVDVVSFVKEVIEKYPKLRQSVLQRLFKTFSEVRSGKVFRGILWIVGEYCLTEADIREAWQSIRESLGEIPILAAEQRLLEKNESEQEIDSANFSEASSASKPSTTKRILADGTYATESAFTSKKDRSAQDTANIQAVRNAEKPPLRALILGGEYFVATVLASTLTKLVLRFGSISNNDQQYNALKAEAMLIMSSIIRVGKSDFAAMPIDEDSADRIMSCFMSLSEATREPKIKDFFLKDTRQAYVNLLKAQNRRKEAADASERAKSAIQVDDALEIRQFSKAKSEMNGVGIDDFEADINRAIRGCDVQLSSVSSNLSRVVQLTGYSDPVYVEALVKINKFDIILDVLIVNQTSETLQNLSMEFATLGDLKIVERPTTQSLGPNSFMNTQATVKVSSADTGVIFGNIIYDGPSTAEACIVILDDVHVNIMEYIKPAECTEAEFRAMWTEFEWENSIKVNSKEKSLNDYLDKLMENTNMTCLTPSASLAGDCGFLSANLYARSIFGEDALANVCVEQGEDGIITGHVRIRSKGQGKSIDFCITHILTFVGMALSLGQIALKAA